MDGWMDDDGDDNTSVVFKELFFLQFLHLVNSIHVFPLFIGFFWAILKMLQNENRNQATHSLKTHSSTECLKLNDSGDEGHANLIFKNNTKHETPFSCPLGACYSSLKVSQVLSLRINHPTVRKGC